MEAEFIQATSAAKMAKYLCAILEELSIEQKGPTPIYDDNIAAIMMTNASKPNGRTRHINISYFAIQEWVSKGDIKLAHIRGVINPSDALTKALGWTLHHHHVLRMMGHMGSRHTSTSGRIQLLFLFTIFTSINYVQHRAGGYQKNILHMYKTQYKYIWD
eukprot:2881511-Ditylum_brightwellii.AAC.1